MTAIVHYLVLILLLKVDTKRPWEFCCRGVLLFQLRLQEHGLASCMLAPPFNATSLLFLQLLPISMPSCVRFAMASCLRSRPHPHAAPTTLPIPFTWRIYLCDSWVLAMSDSAGPSSLTADSYLPPVVSPSTLSHKESLSKERPPASTKGKCNTLIGPQFAKWSLQTPLRPATIGFGMDRRLLITVLAGVMSSRCAPGLRSAGPWGVLLPQLHPTYPGSG